MNSEIVYGEMGTETLRWANHDVFGLNSADMPSSIVITPFKVEEYFEDLGHTNQECWQIQESWQQLPDSQGLHTNIVCQRSIKLCRFKLLSLPLHKCEERLSLSEQEEASADKLRALTSTCRSHAYGLTRFLKSSYG